MSTPLIIFTSDGKYKINRKAIRKLCKNDPKLLDKLVDCLRRLQVDLTGIRYSLCEEFLADRRECLKVRYNKKKLGLDK